jgi:hypothetical protein
VTNLEPTRRRDASAVRGALRAAASLAVAIWSVATMPVVLAQNDWQFPDPRFGTLMRGSATPSVADERRYRSAISPPFSPPAEPRIRATPQHDRRRGRLRRR